MSVSSTAAKAAIRLLKKELSVDRAGAWSKAALFLSQSPALKSELKRHAALVAKLTRRLNAPRRGPTKTLRAFCDCGQPLPHPPRVPGLSPSQKAVIANCFRHFRNRAYVLRGWNRLDPQARAERTAPGRAAYLAKVRAARLARINPRLIQVLGPDEAIRQWLLRDKKHPGRAPC